jgi:hypothetical protein
VRSSIRSTSGTSPECSCLTVSCVQPVEWTVVMDLSVPLPAHSRAKDGARALAVQRAPVVVVQPPAHHGNHAQDLPSSICWTALLDTPNCLARQLIVMPSSRSCLIKSTCSSDNFACELADPRGRTPCTTASFMLLACVSQRRCSAKKHVGLLGHVCATSMSAAGLGP